MRRLVSLLVAAATASTLLLTGTSAQAATPDGLYREAWSTTIYQVRDGVTSTLGGHDWVAMGAPAPQVLTTQFTKTPDDPRIRAESIVGDLTVGGVLTYQQWALAGFPAPIVVPANGGLLKYRSGDDLFLSIYLQPTRRISYQEWSQLGFWYPQLQVSGFYQLGWSDDPTLVQIGLYDTRPPAPLTYAAWAEAGFPNPARVPRFTVEGRDLDSFDQYEGNPAIYYSGPTMTCHHLTPAEWAAAGHPTPIQRGGVPVIGAEPCPA